MGYTITRADLPAQHTAVVREHVPHDGIGAFLGAALGEVMAALGQQGSAPSGAPFARYIVTPDGFDVEAGFPTPSAVAPVGRVHPSTLPGGQVARVLHVGAYDAVGAAYEAAEQWIVENGYRPAGAPWESYLDDPGVAEPRTEVFVPYAAAHR